MATIFCAVVMWTAPAAAGWEIEQQVTGRGWTAQQRVLLQANRMKSILLGAGGRPITSFMVDFSTDHVIQADYAGGQYVAGTTQEYAQLMRWARRQPGPEQPSPCRALLVNVRRSSEVAAVAGYSAVRYDVIVDGGLHIEAWIARSLPAWREIPARRFEQFMRDMASLGACAPGHTRQWLFAADPAGGILDEGFPVRIVDRAGTEGTLELVRARATGIPRLEFEPPPGLGRRDIRDILKP